MRWKGGDRWEYLLGDVAVASNIIEGAMAVRSCSGTPVSVIMETGDRIKGERVPQIKRIGNIGREGVIAGNKNLGR
jgi:hypothetical protein